MSARGMECIRTELVRRGFIENGYIGEVNPSEIYIVALDTTISDLGKGYQVEDNPNHLNMTYLNTNDVINYIIDTVYYR